MNYSAIYGRLMERARNRVLSVFVERHHVLPKCLNGSNEPENIVKLTPEEHYVAHQLLVKIHPGNSKLIWAALAMTDGGRGNHRAGNKLYGWLKREFVRNQKGRKYSAETRAKIGAASKARNSGSAHPMFGRKHSAETKAKIGNANRGRIGPRRGVKVSDETKKKISDAAKLRTHKNRGPYRTKKSA